MNLVSMIMQFLAPTLVSKLASSLGINSTIAQKLIAAALPTILAAMVGKSAQPGGARMLTDILGKQDPGMLGNLANLVGGGQQASIAQQGIGALGSLLGNSALGSLTGALGKFTGTNETATTGLLGMLAPAVLGTLAKEQKSSGLDADGIAKLLAGQKDNIAAAMPGDFAKLLGGTGLLDSIGPNLAKIASPASTAAPAAPAARQMSDRPGASSAAVTSSNWWRWAAALAAIALGWWFFFGGRTPPKVTMPATPQIMIGNANVADQFGGVMNGVRNSLSGIKDVASAQAALPKLREAQADLERLGGLTGQLTGENKKGFANYVASWLPIITPLISSLTANSAVAPILKPVLDALTSRLNAMAKT